LTSDGQASDEWRVDVDHTEAVAGIPAIFPGERINAAVLDYLTSGVAAGMVLPDPGDASLQTVRVVR
jgi:hypothetical protein